MTTQVYIRPAINIGVRQQLKRRGAFDLPGGVALWRKTGWLLLVLIPLVLSVNLFVVSSLQDVARSITAIDDKQHELFDSKIELLAARAGILAPERLQRRAADKLSLYLPSKSQVGRFNRRKGVFIYL